MHFLAIIGFAFAALIAAPALWAAIWIGYQLWDMVHPIAAVVVALAFLVALTFALAKSRILRALYTMPWAFTVVCSSWLWLSSKTDINWSLGLTFVLGLIMYMAACLITVAEDELATRWHLTFRGEIVRVSFGDLRNIWTWVVPSLMAAATIAITFAYKSFVTT